ncbi:SAVED domain-containing protein [Paenibacillus sp. MBLB2552]|uniref:SAVED domain-containing protein n=1 Tax=Paenibacillus mellifer TaxID=2937794 RepID=A0A9X1XYF2_9BACL|nr:SAVED domain-containing protein [Paenibacillus mellifer]MCK8488260.1 SAVED domain-containing protein [Paenibacillus mellifer]
MARRQKNQSEKKRRELTRAELLHLWMVSGGICTFEGCNKRLVANTDGKLTNVGIIAHIIGHKGPRYEFAQQYGFTDDTLEDVRNLMLMCYDHSKLIDDDHTKEQFPPDKLFEMKANHEAWVRSWTDEKRKSLAIVHKRLGPPMATIPQLEQTPNIILQAVENQDEFNDFSPEGWAEGKDDNKKLYKKFVECIKKGEYEVAEVFALSPIPLLIHLGILLSDTIPFTIYQYERDSELWVSKLPEGQMLEPINPSMQLSIGNSKQLVVAIAISGVITQEDVENIASEADQLIINIENPHVKRILYRDQVKEVQKIFKEKTEELIRRNGYKKIHLLYSGPAGLAIELGRSINPNMWPEVLIYQFNYRAEPRYSFALSV